MEACFCFKLKKEVLVIESSFLMTTILRLTIVISLLVIVTFSHDFSFLQIYI